MLRSDFTLPGHSVKTYTCPCRNRSDNAAVIRSKLALLHKYDTGKIPMLC